MADPIIIGSEIKQPFGQDNAKMVGLYRAAVGTGVVSMKDSKTGNDYQCPVGRRLIVFRISAFYVETTSYSTHIIYNSNTANSATGTTVYRNVIANVQTAVNNDCWLEFDAGNYVNAQENGNSCGITMVGIEIDA